MWSPALNLEPEGELFAEFKREFQGLIIETVKVKGSPQPNQVEEAGEKHVLLTKGEGPEPFEYEEPGFRKRCRVQPR